MREGERGERQFFLWCANRKVYSLFSPSSNEIEGPDHQRLGILPLKIACSTGSSGCGKFKAGDCERSLRSPITTSRMELSSSTACKMGEKMVTDLRRSHDVHTHAHITRAHTHYMCTHTLHVHTHMHTLHITRAHTHANITHAHITCAHTLAHITHMCTHSTLVCT